MGDHFNSDALDSLCSQDQLDLLNAVDCLRSQGISHYVSLPQIIVCGDQSSGKSSVLEAISGVSFPVKSNLSTRFPTELVLRKTSHSSVSVSIVPHESRSEVERLALSNFQEKLDGFEGLANLIENAKAAMGISTHGKSFAKDLLRVEVSGPDRPHLTIVDLPGLIHSETKQQSAADVELVQDVVQNYMKEQRSIILAVVSAKNDYANQVVLKLARAADKDGTRTLGVITKPDTLIPDSESEAMYVSLAKNLDVEFRLGWHVLRNLDTELGKWSLIDRDTREKAFFSTGIWQNLAPSLLGVDKLRKRLSTVLLAQIAAELPGLISEIEVKSEACQHRLDMLGEPRASLKEQRLYLVQISQTFQSLVRASVDGTYNDPFFGDARSEPGYCKRIRAVIQNLNLDFSEHITKKGHRQEITASAKSNVPKGVLAITRKDFLDHIQDLMKRTRGRELPGTFNPMIVVDLFLEQSSPWESITRSHVEKSWKAAKEFLRLAVASISDPTTSKALLQHVFEPSLGHVLVTLNEKTTEILTPHQKGHPITYNHYFTETLQKVRNERHREEYSNILKSFFGVFSLGPVEIDHVVDLRTLLDSFVQRTEPDMNRFACSEALDCMEAYYKVALKRFIDDVAVEVIEINLLCSLRSLFSPLTVTSMDDDLVSQIAGESEESRAERDQFKRELEVLRNGLETCKRFVGVRIIGTNNSLVPDWTTSKIDVFESDDESANTTLPEIQSLHTLSQPASPIETSEDREPLPTETLEDPVPLYWGSSKKGKKKKGKLAVGGTVLAFND